MGKGEGAGEVDAGAWVTEEDGAGGRGEEVGGGAEVRGGGGEGGEGRVGWGGRAAGTAGAGRAES